MADEKNTQNIEENAQKGYAERQLVVFTLGNEEFGVDINEVNSIIKMVPITRIP
ncbi:MAG: chemotaxis protein CheW, partial [Nanoarchaeota archaeon]